MLGRKTFICVLLLLTCFMTACNTVFAPTDLVAEAIEQGIIVPIAEQGTREIQWDTVRIGNIEQQLYYHVLAFFPERRTLRFERYGGTFSGMHVSAGDRVSAGDLLAEQSFALEAIEIERDRIALRYEQFQTRFAAELQSRNYKSEETRAALDNYGIQSHESLLLRLAQQELELQRFIFENNNYRDYLRRRLSDIDNYLDGEQIYAPFNGTITYAGELAPGEYIQSLGRAIIEIVCDSVVHFTVTGPPTVIRYGDTFTIREQGGNLEFYVRVISDPLAGRARANEMSFRLAAVCQETFYKTLAEAGLTVLDLAGIPFRLSIGIPLAMDAILVPHSAIHPEDGRNFVFVYDNGNLLKRYVTLGIRFGNDVQILIGLEPGQKVMHP